MVSEAAATPTESVGIKRLSRRPAKLASLPVEQDRLLQAERAEDHSVEGERTEVATDEIDMPQPDEHQFGAP